MKHAPTQKLALEQGIGKGGHAPPLVVDTAVVAAVVEAAVVDDAVVAALVVAPFVVAVVGPAVVAPFVVAAVVVAPGPPVVTLASVAVTGPVCVEVFEAGVPVVALMPVADVVAPPCPASPPPVPSNFEPCAQLAARTAQTTRTSVCRPPFMARSFSGRRPKKKRFTA